MRKTRVRYYVIFRHYDERFPIQHRVEVFVDQEKDFAEEIRAAQKAAVVILQDATDSGYLKGDYMDYNLKSTRKVKTIT